MSTTLHRFYVAFGLLKETFKIFKANDPLRLAGATAFFANFALPPILIILIRVFGLFTDKRTFISNLFSRLSSLLDESSILQVRQTLRNIRGADQPWYITAISFVFFIFVATTMFTVIKTSLDQIWNININEEKGFLFRLKLRGISFIIIVLAGILFFIGLITDSIQAIIGNYIKDAPHSIGLVMMSILNQLIFIGIVTTWFTVLFRFLTNGRPKWRTAFFGGLLTGVLFTGGKFILRFLLPLSNIQNIYGTSGSIVLIMLFVFYSSFIFYFGGCFVKAYSNYRNTPIKPISGTYAYELKALIKD